MAVHQRRKVTVIDLDRDGVECANERQKRTVLAAQKMQEILKKEDEERVKKGPCPHEVFTNAMFDKKLNNDVTRLEPHEVSKHFDNKERFVELDSAPAQATSVKDTSHASTTRSCRGVQNCSHANEKLTTTSKTLQFSENTQSCNNASYQRSTAIAPPITQILRKRINADACEAIVAIVEYKATLSEDTRKTGNFVIDKFNQLMDSWLVSENISRSIRETKVPFSGEKDAEAFRLEKEKQSALRCILNLLWQCCRKTKPAEIYPACKREIKMKSNGLPSSRDCVCCVFQLCEEPRDTEAEFLVEPCSPRLFEHALPCINHPMYENQILLTSKVGI